MNSNRLKNLRLLIEQWDGPSNLAAKLGYAKPSFLVQMAGPNPSRVITERTARKIERTLDLPRGFLDEEQARPPKVKPDLVQEVVLLVGDVCDESGLKLTSSKFANVVALAYTDALESGSPRRDYVARLIALTK